MEARNESLLLKLPEIIANIRIISAISEMFYAYGLH
jgi:hypothetical protein